MLLAGAVVVLVHVEESTTSQDSLSTGRPDRRERAELASEVLSRLELAVSNHDAAAPTGDASGTVLANAGALRISDFHLRYVEEDPGALTGGSEQWVAAVDATWRLTGIDPGPVRAPISFTFRRVGTQAVIAAIGGHGRRTPLWLAHPVAVVRRPGVVVLAQGGDAVARRYAALASTARAQVRAVVGRWTGGVVVEVPRSTQELDAALLARPGEYDEIAAVTTTVDGTRARRSPQHVFINPEVYEPLRHPGSQVVMTHEVVHVAMRAATSSAPLWLVEGFADYVALHDVRLPLSETAAELRTQVLDGEPPTELPSDAAFGSGEAELDAAYEAAWLACVTLADLGGEHRLVEFYDRVQEGGSVATETREVFGVSHAFLIRSWRARLRHLAE